MKSITLPQTEKHKLFAEHQEGARKDVERAFGVLQSRFSIVRRPARLPVEEEECWKDHASLCDSPQYDSGR